MKIDTDSLSEVITECFNNSTSGRFTTEQQDAFAAEGKRLRKLLMSLISVEFTEGTRQVADANAQLKALNTELRASATDLAKTATTLNNVARLVGTLDGLLSLV